MRCQWGPCYRTATVQEDGYWWCWDDVQQHRAHLLSEELESRAARNGGGVRIDVPLDFIRDQVLAGMTDAAIAKRLGVSTKVVWTRRQELGFTATHAQRAQSDRDAEMIDLHGRGLTDLEIGRMLGVSQRSVERRRHRLHLPVNQPAGATA